MGQGTTRRGVAAVVMVALLAGAPEAAAGIASDLLDLTGGTPMRIVWSRETSVLAGGYVFEESAFELMKFDTSVGTEEVLSAGPASYQHPLITPDGQKVLWFDYDANATVIINWDGSNKHTFCDGYLYDVFRDDSGVDWVVVNDWVHVWSRPQPAGSVVSVRKVRLDNPTVSEVILVHPDQKGETFDVSRDCLVGGGLLIHPTVGVYDLTTDAFSQRGSYACNTDVAPDNSYMFWHMQGGGHTNVVLYHNYPTTDSRTVYLNNAPNLNGAESWNPRWTNDVRFFTMTGPIAWTASQPRFNIYVGRFDSGITQVEAWVQVTDNDLLDGNANGWIGQASQAPTIASTPTTTACVGAEYTYAISTLGTPAPSLSVSGAPAWLTLSGDVLSGTPAISDAGTTGTIVITATSPQGYDQQLFQIDVEIGDADLVGYWSFDEQASPGADGSAYANDGTLAGDATWTASGRDGGALALSGAGHLAVPDAPSISLTSDFTVAAWFSLPSLEDGVFNIVGKSFNDGYRLRLGVDQGASWCGFELLTNDGGGVEGGWYDCPAMLSTGTWYHVTATFDAATGEKRFYLDGVYGGSTATTGRSVQDTTGPLALGAGDTSPSECWKGLLDEVRIYTRLLSDQDVADLPDASNWVAPEITSTAPTTAVVDVPYTYTIVATGDPTPAIGVSGDPSWLTLSGSTLFGTPSASDLGPNGTVTVTATNAAGGVTQTFTLTVLEPPSIELETPETGDVWYVGTTPHIHWSTVVVEDVTICVSIDGGSSWIEIASSVRDTEQDWGALPWTVPATASTDCRILIHDYFYPQVSDTSGAFEIRDVSSSDGDAMDDGWETSHFGDTVGDGSEDYDGDGVTDGDEFADGTDPTDPTDHAPIPLYGAGTTGLSCAAGHGGGSALMCAAMAICCLAIVMRRRAERGREPAAD